MPSGRSAVFDLRALYLALDAQRQSRGLTWQQAISEINRHVESSSGLHPIARSTVSSLRTKAVAEGDGVLQMLRWLQRTPESFVPGLDALEAHRLPDAPPSRTLRFDTRRLHAALDAQRTARGLTWQQVANEIGGMGAAGLIHLKNGGRTGFPVVMRLTGWLGRPVADFVRVTDL